MTDISIEMHRELTGDQMPCITLECMTYGDDSIGRAAYICSRHEILTGYVYPEGGRPHQWKAPWEACRKVWNEWQQGDAARQIREARAAEAKELEFVNSIADTLP